MGRHGARAAGRPGPVLAGPSGRRYNQFSRLGAINNKPAQCINGRNYLLWRRSAAAAQVEQEAMICLNFVSGGARGPRHGRWPGIPGLLKQPERPQAEANSEAPARGLAGGLARAGRRLTVSDSWPDSLASQLPAIVSARDSSHKHIPQGVNCRTFYANVRRCPGPRPRAGLAAMQRPTWDSHAVPRP